MKKIYNLIVVMAALMMWSCDEENLDPVGNWTLSEPELGAPAADVSVVLDENAPLDEQEFTWNAAVSSENYGVTYVFRLTASDSPEEVLLQKKSSDNGKSTSVLLTNQEIDQALSGAGYDVGEVANVNWTVVANSLSKSTVVSRSISFTRFTTEALPTKLYLTGAATEAGEDVTNAIPMRALKDGDGSQTYVFELYTSLEAGKGFMFYSKLAENAIKYGGDNGLVDKDGPAIQVGESATYRITVDMNTETYSLLKIDKWSIVGNVIPGGWGGDEALIYQGGSVWSKSITLAAQDAEAPRFIFRANGDWGYLLKRIQGTGNEIYMESQSAAAGVAIEDITIDELGKFIITLDLSGDTYTYDLEKDNSVDPPSETPANLFLLADGEVVKEFTKQDDKFMSEIYIALDDDKAYTLNSASDGSGTSYSLSDAIGATDSPDGDAVSGATSLLEGAADVAIARDQAYQLTIDFASASVSWKYYNIKLFHWSDWDSRDEFVMTYVDPHTFTVTADLQAGYAMKFNSPWDVQLGSDTPSALSGNLLTDGSEDLNCISESGNYTVTITTSEDYKTGTYEFVKN